MSSEKVIIVAIRHRDGKVRLPLDDMTLYSREDLEELIRTSARTFDEGWGLAGYAPVTGWFHGTKAAPDLGWLHGKTGAGGRYVVQGHKCFESPIGVCVGDTEDSEESCVFCGNPEERK